MGTMAPSPSASAGPGARRLPNEIRWFRNSAEYRALTTQVYREAMVRLPELTRGFARDSWAVILDADETILDNSEYQRRRASLDSAFSDPTWVAWVRERAATPVPGALAFVQLVHTMGGKVAVVTNRADSLCAATRENLTKLGAAADIVLCQPPGQSDKNPRFQRIQSGGAAPGTPPLTVVAWVGDNIQDFPGLTQAVRDDPTKLADFGRRFFVLPNPMYGSWERNPDR
jgi:5'-nucleotidase (lipoprotein e(P4) family)